MHYPTLTKLLAMAISRETWIDQLSGKLSGAFREWCKQKLADEIGYKRHNWNHEVEILLTPVRDYLTGRKKTKSKFKIKTAFKEAMEDALGSNRLQKAKYLLEEHPLTKEQRMRLEKTVLDEQLLFQQMLKEYLDKELKLIGF